MRLWLGTNLLSSRDVFEHLLDGIFGSSVNIRHIPCWMVFIDWQVLWVSVDDARTAEHHIVDPVLFHDLRKTSFKP